ncbi:GNAT family N-acetyltransferase [Vagococcus elongatus]|uniref:N-acetyltransferase domain-containing protein n=1 Tax=Vagococcus elongatus TaxID=180344 RepID=A0A430B5B3_9ENTE|nr:GNAT family N-acetyltransferase [Vagococcus elongatus]RSU15550.1 hypothetical protein CBF29_00290 [Vagococcus elongatus]
MGNIRLIDINKDNWLKLCLLTPGEAGEKFVAPNAISIVQSVYDNDGQWVIKGIAHGNDIIGFTMYGYNVDDKAYDLCRFMLDQKFQGRGYGQKALKVIVEEMCARFNCEKIYLSTDPENSLGKYIYEKFGFINTGQLVDGEELFVLDLP